MSKVLVDRELLDLLRNFTFLHDDGCAGAIRGNIDMALAAQPAETEGVSNARLMNTLAELARRAPLRTLHTICETQRQVSTVKLERYLGPIGDTLAGYAFTLRIDFDKLSAALSAVTAERDGLAAARMAYANEFAPDENGDPDVGNVHANIRALKAERDRVLAEREGKVLVTTEPTEAMLTAYSTNPNHVASAGAIYRAMLSAAMAAKEA